MLCLAMGGCRTVEQSTLAPPPVGGFAPRQVTPAAAVQQTAEAPGAGAPAAAVLAWWDERRAAAWRSLDPAELDALYLPDSRAGEIDVAHLEAYAGAGVRVHGWQTARTSLHEVRREPSALVVDVVTAQREAVVGISSRRGAGAVETRRLLPSTGSQGLRISLHWAWPAGGWAVGRVRPLVDG